MIHTVTVLAGESDYVRIAQAHAIRMAGLFRARLRVAVVWESGNAENVTGHSKTWEVRADDEVKRISREAGLPDLIVERSLRGEGFLRGLLSEAREADLLVVGLPECPTGDEPECMAIRNEEMPLFHKAESMVLVVCHSPVPIRKVLVDYHGGSDGKMALRAAGEVASRVSAAVTVLSVDGDREKAGLLASSGVRYLNGFGISDVATVVKVGEPSSEDDVLSAAQSAGADLVVIAGERHGLMEALRSSAAKHPEELATYLHVPVLIAR